MLEYVAKDEKKFSMTIRFDLVYLDHGDEYYMYGKDLDLKEFKRITTKAQALAEPQHQGWLCNYL